MIKRVLVIFFQIILFSAFLNAQPYGNEWINYSQYYYKFYISENGVYRLTYNTLLNSGIPINSINPRNIQIFNKGVEQYIYIRGENDNVFNTDDYIEIYAEKNDGSLDTQLYINPEGQANKEYSLFSDSAAYFLTWNNSLNNRRMITENDVNFGAYSPVPFIYKISRVNYTSRYYAGETNSAGITDPEYTACEGWFDNPVGLGQSVTKNIPTANKYPTGNPAEIEYIIVSASNVAGINPDHHLRISFAGKTIDTLFDGYKTIKINYTAPLSELGNTTTPFTLSSINDLGATTDRSAIAYIQVKYAHTLNLEGQNGFLFYAQDAPQAKSFFNFTNLNVASGDTVRLYDITNHKRIKVVTDGSIYKCLLSNSGGEKKCFITSDNYIKQITKLYPVAADARFVNYLNIANTQNSDYFIVTHRSLWNEALQYADYRNSTGYNALVLDVDHLYDQFAYGVLKSPLSIKNFIRFAYDYFSVKPKYLFLIGKAYRAGYDGSSVEYRKNALYNSLTLVPSMGNPPSDLLFSKGINDNLYRPAVPTGRLSARTPEHVSLYLNKVIQYESEQQQPHEWMKKILHFGGGLNIYEQSTFAAYLNNYKQIIQSPYFGGNVTTFLKTSSEPFQINVSDSIKNLVNNGVTMMTFFGHAASIGFDVSVNDPSEWENYGRYPFLLANSCYAGDIFLHTNSSSEEFLLIPNKGVIGYLASIALGIPWALDVFSNALYKNISFSSYGNSIGNIIKNTIQDVQVNDLTIKETCLTMTLHSDPAIKLNPFDKPDYLVTPQSITFDPPVVTTEADSFNIVIIATNIGKAIVDSFIVHIQRTFPDGNSVSSYFKMIPAPYYKDTLAVKIPTDIVKGIGLNKFKVTLDYYNEIDEITKLNNTAEVTLFIQSSDIVPVYPYKYAVIPSLPVTLKASTGYPFLQPTDFVFELDTTDAFNSPIKQTYHVQHGGGVVNWTPNFPITSDSIVYYWRVSKDSTANQNYNWRESSFQYISGKRGWGQAHFYQFKNNTYRYVSYNKPLKKFEFVNNIHSILCKTGVYPNIPWTEIYYKVNNVMRSQWAYLGPSGNGILLAVFDSISGEPWLNYNMPQPEFESRWEFSTSTAAGRSKLKSFLQDSIPSGNYVLAYSHRNHYAQNYEEDLYQQFEAIGSAQIRTLQNNVPYIIFGKKGGAIGSAHEVKGTSSTSIITLEDSTKAKWYEGNMVSELIGPASKWLSLHWRQKPYEIHHTDKVRLSVLGIKPNNTIDTLIKNLPPDSSDIYNLNTRIDAQTYPFLKLVVFMRDDSLHTPAQMKRWQVLYEGVPETALNPSLHFIFKHDTVQEGENIIFSTATQNISDYDMDSLLIKYWIIDKNLNTHPLGAFRHRPHPAGDILKDTIIFSTKNLNGLNSLWIEVNPDNDQPEQYHFNNIGEIKFYVGKDNINPLLDVTFDGIHILDGDIVSAKPEIQITLKDENKFLELNDTACFRVYIQKPGSNELDRIFFRKNGAEIMQFIPAVLPNNSCRIIYPAVFTEDGVYKLFVEAQDISKNESGCNRYSISFEVINKPTITHVMNWPNPFTTATHFVFTLTGSEIPTYFKIQIMTITGKVVREIDLSELGPIHIGRNITEYAWDGRDEFGDRLANGVYLYRVITRLNGEKIELNPTKADQYFKKEFGKMYLMGN